MAINIQAKNDVSYLFSSLGSGAKSVAGSDFLSQYASIKNGSYGKLMKAYYAGKDNLPAQSGLQKNENGTDSKLYAKISTGTDALKDSADALLAKGSKDIFSKDSEAVYGAVKSFVENYNSVVDSAGDSGDNTVIRRATAMVNGSIANMKSLSAIGISVKENGLMSIDKESFMKADMSKVKSLFQGNGSYGYQVSAQASLIHYAAESAADKGSAYTIKGTYNSGFSNGNLFNSYF